MIFAAFTYEYHSEICSPSRFDPHVGEKAPPNDSAASSFTFRMQTNAKALLRFLIPVHPPPFLLLYTEDRSAQLKQIVGQIERFYQIAITQAVRYRLTYFNLHLLFMFFHQAFPDEIYVLKCPCMAFPLDMEAQYIFCI